MKDSPVVVSSAPETFEAITIRFIPGRGLCADAMPLRALVAPEMLALAASHAGAISVKGQGGLGTRLTFELANCAATYEVTDYAQVVDPAKPVTSANSIPLLVVERRTFELRLAGKPVEVRRFGLADLNALADSWPGIVAFYEDVLDAPRELGNVLRVRNRYTRPEVRINLGGSRVLYNVMQRFMLDDGRPVFIAERARLQTDKETLVRLPTAAAVGRLGMAVLS